MYIKQWKPIMKQKITIIYVQYRTNKLDPMKW